MGFTDKDRRAAREIIGRYPYAKSAMLPLLHLAQDRDGWVTPEAMEEIAEILDLTPALVLGVCSFYSMLKREPVGRLVVSVCTNLSCMVNGGMDLHAQLRAKYAGDPDVSVEEVECIAHCDRAPAFQVNYDFHGPGDLDGAADLIERYKDGQLALRTISGTSAGEVR
ncbi:MAG TPA: NAD(P)H-dependent oxidoreductase subunit E [Acidimicrobiia bacterium]|nr:NAD(P)H-dependent oxidoreductase subunit E [Acidimicrobiia bacterium]